jgi:hypothetical protein
VRAYAVVSEQMCDEALELFVDRQMAELMVENWNRDEPDRAGELHAGRSCSKAFFRLPEARVGLTPPRETQERDKTAEVPTGWPCL